MRLHRVLGGDHEEWLGQVIARPVHTDLMLGHRLEQRRLRSRRSAVDLVGQQDVGENRSAVEFEGLVALVVDRHAGDVGGQQVGSELYALELRIDAACQRFRQRGLAGAGVILQEHVATAQESGDQLADAGVLALHDALDPSGDAFADLLGRGLAHGPYSGPGGGKLSPGPGFYSTGAVTESTSLSRDSYVSSKTKRRTCRQGAAL